MHELIPGTNVLTQWLYLRRWAKVVDTLLADLTDGHGPMRVMVLGNKGVGKSTFGRYLVNRLLGQQKGGSSAGGSGAGVTYVDTDIGQPELTPSGNDV